MSHASYQPTSVQSHHFIGIKVFLEIHRRLCGGNFGTIPSPLKDDAFSMGGYCLDAHDTLPAGSTVFEAIGPNDDEWLWAPTTCEREEPKP